jgi:hypothetical protein
MGSAPLVSPASRQTARYDVQVTHWRPDLSGRLATTAPGSSA